MIGSDPQHTILFDQAARYASAYRDTVRERPQRPELDYGAVLQLFEEPTPERGMPAEMVIDDLVARATPGLHTMTGPRFFGWVIGASHPVGVAADFLASAWGQNSSMVVTPASAVVEAVVTRWLLDLLDLPPEASVGFTTGATTANLTCLAAARGNVLRRAGWDVEADGLFGAPPVHVLVGADAHAVVFSALQLLGLGHDRVIQVPADDQGRILPSAFAERISACDGPIIAILQAGHVNTGAFDPVLEIAPVAHARGAWIHVDGAFGLWARACPDRADLARGLQLADSWATDGHKWLQTPYDSGFAIVRDVEAHRRAMTILASYLPLAGEHERTPADYVPELSRRARGFATWAMIRHLGRDGIARMIEGHCHLARKIAQGLAGEPGVSILNDVVLNQLIVRFGSEESADTGDQLTQATIRHIQEAGACFMAGARWRGRAVMRVSVISASTTEEDADRTIEAVLDAWRKVRASTTAPVA